MSRTDKRMAQGRGAVLLSLGILLTSIAFIYMPRCADIPQFSMLCLGRWLPVMVPLIVWGGASIAFGTLLLLKGND